MESKLSTPKVFISYSWNPESNKKSVLELAEKLMLDGIDVTLDVWDLKEGHDKYQFMEKMVADEEINKVLLICNKEYKEKADLRSGGVGVESVIVSDEVYKKTRQEKFIPVVLEYEDGGEACLPTFVKSRIYIDLSNDDIYQENYEKLVRNIFNKSLTQKPPLGVAPSYINDDIPNLLPTAHKVNALKNALLKEKKNVKIYIDDYLDSFISSLENYHVTLTVDDKEIFDDIIVEKIEELKPLRDDFIYFLELYNKYSIKIDIERLHLFFEQLLENVSNREGYYDGSKFFGSLQNDHYRFFCYELFLYASTILIENEKFSELRFLLETPYIYTKAKDSDLKHESFISFYSYNETLEVFRNQRKHNSTRVSVSSDLLKQRTHSKFTFDQLIQSEILLYYCSLFFIAEGLSYFKRYAWFPSTSCHANYSRFPLFKKVVSLRYFNKIKNLFGVETKQDLIDKTNSPKVIEHDNKLQRFHFEVPLINEVFNIDTICSIP